MVYGFIEELFMQSSKCDVTELFFRVRLLEIQGCYLIENFHKIFGYFCQVLQENRLKFGFLILTKILNFSHQIKSI